MKKEHNIPLFDRVTRNIRLYRTPPLTGNRNSTPFRAVTVETKRFPARLMSALSLLDDVLVGRAPAVGLLLDRLSKVLAYICLHVSLDKPMVVPTALEMCLVVSSGNWELLGAAIGEANASGRQG